METWFGYFYAGKFAAASNSSFEYVALYLTASCIPRYFHSYFDSRTYMRPSALLYRLYIRSSSLGHNRRVLFSFLHSGKYLLRRY
jgi:hypothetical protein